MMASSWLALYIAYSIVWLGVFGYLTYLFLRQRRIAKDISLLKEEVARHGKPGS